MKRLIPLLLLLPSFVAGCSSPNETSSSQVSTDAYINVAIDSLTVMEEGTAKIDVEIIKQGTYVFFSSADSDIATVDDEGIVTGVKEGTTTITIRGGRDTFIVYVTVTPYQARESLQITLTKKSFTLENGDSFVLPLKVKLGGEEVEAELSYEIENPAVVAIFSTTVTALSVGSTKVVASATYATYNAHIGFSITVY